MENANDSEVRHAEEVGQVQKAQKNEATEEVEPEEIIEPPTDAHCPSCNGPGIRKGKTILCELCDCSFRYTKEGPKVEEVGPFDRLAGRVSNIENRLGVQPAEPKVAQPAEPETAQPAEPWGVDAVKPPPAEPEIADDGI